MNELIWQPVVRFPLDKDLKPFLNFLKQQAIATRVTEEDGEQQLWMVDQSRILDVADYAAQWASGDLALQPQASRATVDPSYTASKSLIVWHFLSLLPVSVVLLVLGILGALLVYMDRQTLAYAEPFLFQAIRQGQIMPLSASLAAGEYWRIFTPVFIHFGLLHVAFNCLLLWEIGRRIEQVKGSLHYVFCVVIIGIIGNIAQYIASPNAIFGGLSGIVYGVIGYVGVYQIYVYHPILQFNKAAIAFSIVWILLGVSGIVDVFIIGGGVANTAHISGLIMGAIIGAVVAFIDKQRAKKNS